MEFVFVVYFFSMVRVLEVVVFQKRGVNIIYEVLEMVSKLFLIFFFLVMFEIWYLSIVLQFLVLFDGDEGLEFMRMVFYIIGFGILGCKVFGVLGIVGWKCFVEFLFYVIKFLLNVQLLSIEDDDEIVDFSKERVFVEYQDFVIVLCWFRLLVVLYLNQGLVKCLLLLLLLFLWIFFIWNRVSLEFLDKVCGLVLELLKIYLKFVFFLEFVFYLIRNFGYVGGYN